MVVLALILGAVLNAEGLRRTAAQQPFGAVRDLALTLTGPLATLNQALGLDGPHRALAHAADAPAPVTKLAAAVDPRPQAALVRRTVTAQRPLRVWMGGDSLIGTVGDAVARAEADDPRVAVTTDTRIGTGLARPDVLDWQARLTTELPAVGADVVVLAMGANDDQDMAVDGQRVALGTAPWRHTYQQRVGALMDVAAGDDRQVVWIALPPVAPERLAHVRQTINAVARRAAADRPAVTYLDIAGPITDPSGRFATHVVGDQGLLVRVRERDGVHIAPEGAARVAPLVVDALSREWDLAGTADDPNAG